MKSPSKLQDASLKAGAAIAVSVIMMPVTGCGAPAAEAVLQSSNQMKELILAIRNYEDVHEGWPDSLDQVGNLVDSDLNVLMQNPITGDNPGYEYVPPSADSDPSTTVILYQLRDGRRDTNLRVGFADGRVAELAHQE